MLALEHWGSKWAELRPEHAHPGVVLGVGDLLPGPRPTPPPSGAGRFEYPTLSGPGRRGWLLIERGDAEVCEKYPGGNEDLVVVINEPVAFARWHLGELRSGVVLRSGAIR